MEELTLASKLCKVSLLNEKFFHLLFLEYCFLLKCCSLQLKMVPVTHFLKAACSEMLLLVENLHYPHLGGCYSFPCKVKGYYGTQILNLILMPCCF